MNAVRHSRTFKTLAALGATTSHRSHRLAGPEANHGLGFNPVRSCSGRRRQ